LLGSAARAADARVEPPGCVARGLATPIRAERAVLQAHVVVVDRDDADRSHRERIPVTGEGRVPAVAGEVEAGLVGQVALGTVADLVLVVARAGHPRPVSGGAHVVVEEASPGLDRRV